MVLHLDVINQLAIKKEGLLLLETFVGLDTSINIKFFLLFLKKYTSIIKTQK